MVVTNKNDKRAIRLIKAEKANNIRTKEGYDQQFIFKLFDRLTEEETAAYCSALAKLCERLNELKQYYAQ